MALKDWKKIQNKKFVMEWEKKKGFTPKNILMTHSSRLFRGKVGWEVDINIRTIRKFKTKTLALKFVRDYMRKH